MGPNHINERLRLISNFLSTLAGNIALTGIVTPLVTFLLKGSLDEMEKRSLIVVVVGCTLSAWVLFDMSLKTLAHWIEEENVSN